MAILKGKSEGGSGGKVWPGGYREVLGSDVPNDGMYIELHDAAEQVVACVFRSDSTGELEVHIGYAEAPEEVVSSFVQRAKDRLNARASA